MYGAPTAKRHIGWSNCPTVACLDLGKMIKALHNRRPLKSSKTYTNKRGKKAFCGSHHLRSTGTLASCYCNFFLALLTFPLNTFLEVHVHIKILLWGRCCFIQCKFE